MGSAEDAEARGIKVPVDVPRVLLSAADSRPIAKGWYVMHVSAVPDESGALPEGAVHHMVVCDEVVGDEVIMKCYEPEYGDTIRLADTPLHEVADVLGVDCWGRSESLIAELCVREIRRLMSRAGA